MQRDELVVQPLDL